MASAQTPGEVTLAQMLDARERRACRQRELLEQYRKPLLCFTMNIAGPVKDSALIRQGFRAGIEDFLSQMKRLRAAVLYREILREPTGGEAFFVVDIDGFLLKQLVCELEEADELGRLFDMDVLLPAQDGQGSGRKLERREVGFPERECLLCGKPAKECASRRTHTVRELQEAVEGILVRSLNRRYANQIAELATRSLLYEAAVSPKPGLVDRFHSGSHQDMDIYTFLDSAAALWPYFHRCARAGLEYGQKEDMTNLLPVLRRYGKAAEAAMFSATGGVNTHKGAVFTMGILCAAAGVHGPDEWTDSRKILKTCAEITRNLIESDFSGLTAETAKTAGEKLYAAYGITGVRGQMAEGLPAVSRYGLPLLSALLSEGKSADEAGAAALLAIMAHMTDTNLIARSDIETQKRAMEMAEKALREARCPAREVLEAMDREFTAKNLSPGGSADLLAVCWMLYFLQNTMNTMK